MFLSHWPSNGMRDTNLLIESLEVSWSLRTTLARSGTKFSLILSNLKQDLSLPGEVLVGRRCSVIATVQNQQVLLSF